MKQVELAVVVLMLSSWGLLGAGPVVGLARWALARGAGIDRTGALAWRSTVQLNVRRRWRHCSALASAIWHAYRQRTRRTDIYFLVADPKVGRELAPVLRRGLRQLAGATGRKLPVETVVLVQLKPARDGALRALPEALQLPGGSRRILIRLALESEGQPCSPDQVLASLAEQYLNLLDGDRAGRSKAEATGTFSDAAKNKAVASADAVADVIARKPHLLVVASQGEVPRAPKSMEPQRPHASAADPLVVLDRTVERTG